MKKELPTYEDIMFEIPWTCGERDCPTQWHKTTYWLNQKGKKTSYTVDHYSDGDHEPVLKKDIPSMKKCDKAWKEYNEYVARTGCDPLGSFRQPESENVVHRMQALVRQGVQRVLLKGFRKAGKTSPWLIKSVPRYVKDYLDLKRANTRWVLDGFKTLKEIKKCVKEQMQGDTVKIRTKYEAVIDFNAVEIVPIKAAVRKAAVKKAAQEALLN